MKTKICSAFLAFLFLGYFSAAQTAGYLWAQGTGNGGNSDNAYIVASDPWGNAIVTGAFSSATMSCGGTTLYNADTAGVDPDVFVVKYDPAGNVLWARSAGGSSQDEGFCVSTDASGNVIVCGYFSGATITFGSVTLTNTFAGLNDFFIVKYDPTGTVLWARNGVGGNDEYAQAVSVDPSGNIFVTGGFGSSSLTIGSTTLYNASSTLGDMDMFIAGYDPSGNVIWAYSAGGAETDFGLGIAADVTGNITVVGFFSSSSITFDTHTLINAGSPGTQDIFVVKYLASGSIGFAKRAGGAGDDLARNVSTNATDDIFVTGHFASSSITIGGSTLNNAGTGTSDMFLAKYDNLGNAVWANSAGGSAEEMGKRIIGDDSGNATVIGYFMSDTMNFDSVSLTNAGSGTADIYLAKYDATGNREWVQRAGSTGNDYGWGIRTNANNDTYVTGFFNSPGFALGSTMITNSDPTGSTFDYFLAKLITTPPCHAYYSTVYDSASNTFNITVDSATAAAAVTYRWDFGDGTISASPAPVHTYAVDSIYSVCMTVHTTFGDSCFYCSLIGKDTAGNIIRTTGFTINVHNPTTGAQEITSADPEISIYPNPGTGIFSIRSGKPVSVVEVLNILGENILNVKVQQSAETTSVDLSAEPNGIYFIRIISGKQETIKKICISR
ncbi:MAG: type sorting protein [Bacteroidetes bacterium]|nr:type sorting protein [Bacteroidota bacterium]